MMLNHQPVLLNEVLEGLAILPTGIYVDGTFGRGGHSFGILQRLGPEGRLMALDKDPEAVALGKTGSFRDPRFCIVHRSFDELERTVQERGWHGKVNGVLLDLGVSSPQLEDAKRGFSFRIDGPLDMRMNTTQGIDAATWLNQATEAEIRDVLEKYGEERNAKRIAQAIIIAREKQPISRTLQLSEIVARACKAHTEKKHPATRTFQAIRIFINRELEALQRCLPQCVNVLAKGGRLCVISFHSLEDRMVKQFIQKESQGAALPRGLPVREQEKITGRLKKIGSLIRPNEKEVNINPRARSARLRIAEKWL